ncbi:MAG: outer membrane beta-barrel protein [Balneolales bacterium]|nr:outer membrane beta-barrel protein [Balneolales bacterium]
MKKLFTIFLFLFLFSASQAQAQYSIGAAYESRSQEPTSGIGIHFQNDFSLIPLVNLGVRFQGSFYNETYNVREGDFDLRRDDTSYDFGIGLIGTVSAGFVAPYVGVGLGYEVFDRDESIIGGAISGDSGSDNSLYYYGQVGVGVAIIPMVRPYVEYRYRGLTASDFMPSKYGTWAFGVQLRF